MPAIMLADPGMRGMQGMQAHHDQYHINLQMQQEITLFTAFLQIKFHCFWLRFVEYGKV
jgi:hypothetical protein